MTPTVGVLETNEKGCPRRARPYFEVKVKATYFPPDNGIF